METLTIWIIGAVFSLAFSAAVGAYIGSVRNNVARGVWLSILLGPIGWIITAILPTDQPSQQRDARPTFARVANNQSRAKVCPLCGRANNLYAKTCIQCGEPM